MNEDYPLSAVIAAGFCGHVPEYTGSIPPGPLGFEEPVEEEGE